MIGVANRTELYDRITWTSYMDWSEHYRNSGFAPWPLRSGFARLAAQQRNLNRGKTDPPAKEETFLIPPAVVDEEENDHEQLEAIFDRAIRGKSNG